jgi:hypothetical protein
MSPPLDKGEVVMTRPMLAAADAQPPLSLTRTRNGWLVDASGTQFEVERGQWGGWRVASPDGRERVDSSLARAVAAVCRVDTRTGWLLALELRLAGTEA